MPIDFPTRKIADRAATTPTAPAADDTMQLQTAALGDRVSYLGNLAGIAVVPVVTDQSFYYDGSVWASYTALRNNRDSNFSVMQGLGAGARVAGGQNIQWGTSGGVIYGLIRVSTNSSVVIGAGDTASATGTILMRPRGGNDSTNQSTWNNDGSLSCPGGVRPVADNATDFGTASIRVRTYFGVNSAINTSDARLKTEPRQLREAEFKAFSAVCRLPPVWRWLNRVHGDENCEPEGRAARKHFGPTVQAAMQVFAENGLDAFENAPFCYDEWEAEPEQWHEWEAEIDPETGEVTREAGRELIQPAREAGDRYSFRKEELLCGMVSALARESDEKDAKIEAQQVELDELKEAMTALLARVAALEAASAG